MNCPNCEGDDMRSVPLIYEAQTSQGTTSGAAFGGGFLGDAWGAGGARISLEHEHQTDLARRLAPPKKPENPIGCYVASGCGLYLAYLLVDAFFLSQFARNLPGAILGWILLIGLVVLIIRSAASPAHAQAMEAWRRSCSEWERSLLCMRCGKIFIL
jgi:hypothetical protein